MLAQAPPRPPERGSGVAVAVLDSGLSRTHPALRAVAVGEARSFTGQDPLVDTLGHGTECTGLLVARLAPGHPGGLVPGVRLLVGQVIGPGPVGSMSALCAGLDWVARMAPDVVAIPSGCRNDHAAMRHLIGEVAARGVLIVAAAGNPYHGQTGALYPAAYPEVVAVGSRCYGATYHAWPEPPDAVLAADDVPVCTPHGGWRTAGDTSHATMLAAGHACLLIAHRRATGMPRPSREDVVASLSHPPAPDRSTGE